METLHPAFRMADDSASAERPLTMPAVVRDWARRRPRDPALLTPGGTALDYASLWREVQTTAGTLASLGIRRGDRVVLALPQGPEMVVAFLGVSCVAVAAPLDPGAGADDLAALLSQLEPAAVITAAGSAWRGDALLAAPVLRIELERLPSAPAGCFRLQAQAGTARPDHPLPVEGDLALILPTSGTTSRPKLVLQTHGAVRAAAANSAAAFGLTGQDRCLDPMPLFHAHGLIAAAMSSLVAGSSVVCTPRFDAERFFDWLLECRPTWYTAVPTMHRAILEVAPRRADVLGAVRLRFVRSASAHLPAALRADLETTFGALVTEGYGLSEAMQLTNTPLDLGKRKVGSLGIVGSSEIAIADDQGALLPRGVVGEVVCKGPCVMVGYLNNDKATAEVFRDGWLRSGDLGYLDEDGHLFMTGRLKEVINRGGDKVLPQEIDETLLAHPEVAKAVTFGIPDPALGEEVVAVVSLRPAAAADAAELRRFVATRLSAFKVPRRILVVPEIPASATGKLVRRTVAQRFGSQLVSTVAEPGRLVPPSDELEVELLRVLRSALNRDDFGITDDFFDLGGDSLAATRIMVDLGSLFERELDPGLLFAAPTVEQLARKLRAEPDDPFRRPLVELRGGTGQPPLVLLHGAYDGGGFYARRLAQLIDTDQPFCTLAPFGLAADGTTLSIVASAQAYIRTLRERSARGPYMLIGFSHAGLIAYEMTCLLEQAGEKVALLALIDQPAPPAWLRTLRRLVDKVGAWRGLGEAARDQLFLTWRWRLEQVDRHFRRGPLSLVAHVGKALQRRLRTPAVQQGVQAADARFEVPSASAGPDDPQPRLQRAYWQTINAYVPRSRVGRLCLLAAADGRHAKAAKEPTMGWHRWADNVQVVTVPGDHLTCITTHVKALAAAVSGCARQARPSPQEPPARRVT